VQKLKHHGKNNTRKKMAIKDLLNTGKSYGEISKALNIGFFCVRKWGQILKKEGCLNPPMGRPLKGSLSTFSQSIIAKIDEYRPRAEGWGAETIKVELALDEELKSLKIPSASSIDKYLNTKGRTRERNKHVPLNVTPAFITKTEHEIWQLDAEGNCQVKEIHTKVYIQNFPCLLAGPYNHPTTINYQNVLRLGMLEYGMPQGVQADHESIYYDNVNASPFPTNFHLWLIGLDLKLHLTPKGQPYKQGSVERNHQTMQIQVIQGQIFACWEDIFKRCQQRKQRLNYHIPCRPLGKKAPLEVCPQAAHSSRNYHPILEQELFSLNRIYTFLSLTTWYRKISTMKTVCIGSNSYYLSKATPHSETRITFDESIQCFVFHDPNGQIIDTKKAKGLTFKELAGDVMGFFKNIEKIYPLTPP
jgi:transposase